MTNDPTSLDPNAMMAQGMEQEMGGMPMDPLAAPESAPTNPLENVPAADEVFAIDHINYANDGEKTARFKEEILDKLIQIEDERGELENLWSECEDIWAMQNNSNSRYYTGINDAYMPTGFRAMETHVQHVMSQLFPLEFALVPKSPLCPPMFIEHGTRMLEQDAEQADLETKSEDLIRKALTYGWVVSKIMWKEEYKRNYGMHINAQNEMVAAAGLKPVKTYCGPTFDIIDPYDLYVYPFDAESIRSATIVHEYMKMPVQILRKNDAGLQNNPELPFVNVNKIDEVGAKLESQKRRGTELKNLRNSKFGLRTDRIQDKSMREVVQVWAKFDLYGTDDLIDVKATVCNGVILELRQNPLKFQSAPYRLWSPFNTSRSIYKRGMAEIMRVLVYILNAIINQMLDANLFQTNQMMAVDVNRYKGDPNNIEITPFSIFPFEGIGPVKDAISFFKPEMNLQQTLLAANLVASTIQDSVAASAAIQGKYSSKERTKGEVDTVTAAAMTGVSQMVRSLAVTIFKGWLKDAMELERQNRDPEDEFRITGLPPFKFPFEWRADDLIDILVTPEAQEYKMMQQQMEMLAQTMNGQTETGGDNSGDGSNANPGGVNQSTQPDGMGSTGSFGTDGGMG